MEGFSIGRFSSHRPSKSADDVPQLHPSNSDDAPLSDAISKKPPRSSLSWLPPIAWRRPPTPPVVSKNRRQAHQISAPSDAVLSSSLPSSADLPHHRLNRMLQVPERNAAALIKEPSDSGTTSRSWLRRASSASQEKSRRSLMAASQDLAGLLPFSGSSANVSAAARDPSPSPVAQQSGKWSANVQHLIQETDRAFEAVGHVISQVQLPYFQGDLAEPKPSPPIVLSPPSLPRQSPVSSHQHSPNQDGLVDRRPLARKASITKSQRRKRGRKLSQDGFGGARSQARAIPWTLAESVGNTLGQRFKRVVADEMLTPDRMAEMKRSRQEAQEAEARVQREYRSSTESNRSTLTDFSDPSVGPFYLEGLALNVETTADYAPGSSAATECRAVAVIAGEEVVHSDFHAPKSAAAQNDKDDAPEALNVEELAFPSPPKNFWRQETRNPQGALLPTIPEVFSAAPGSLRRRPGTRRRCRKEQSKREEPKVMTEDGQGRVFLRSTPLSFANLAFRHGPISFQRPEAGKRRCAEDVDETVDWTAFQMAILGGAGDLASGMYEDDQNQMADDMVEWFETFGFETPGRLIAADGRPPLDPPHNIYSSSASTINSDMDLPIPVHSETQFWHVDGAHSGVDTGADTVRFFRGGNNGNVTRSAAREQQSSHGFYGRDWKHGAARPMVVGEEVPEDVSGDLAERVPMGCNLEHDLNESCAGRGSTRTAVFSEQGASAAPCVLYLCELGVGVDGHGAGRMVGNDGTTG